MHVTIVVKTGPSIAGVIGAAASVATLGIAAVVATEVLDQSDKLNKTVEKVTKPVNSLRSRFKKGTK